MKRKNCPNCGAPYEADLIKCPFCGSSYFELDCLKFERCYMRIELEGRTLIVRGFMTGAIMNHSVSELPSLTIDFTVERIKQVLEERK